MLSMCKMCSFSQHVSVSMQFRFQSGSRVRQHNGSCWADSWPRFRSEDECGWKGKKCWVSDLSAKSLGARIPGSACAGTILGIQQYDRELLVGVRLPQVFRHNAETKREACMKSTTNAACFFFFFSFHIKVKTIMEQWFSKCGSRRKARGLWTAHLYESDYSYYLDPVGITLFYWPLSLDMNGF